MYMFITVNILNFEKLDPKIPTLSFPRNVQLVTPLVAYECETIVKATAHKHMELFHQHTQLLYAFILQPMQAAAAAAAVALATYKRREQEKVTTQTICYTNGLNGSAKNPKLYFWRWKNGEVRLHATAGCHCHCQSKM